MLYCDILKKGITMKAETLLEMMESKQYESLTVSEFAKIVRDTMNKFEEKEVPKNYTPREDKYYETV